MLLALKNETLMRNDRCTPRCRLRRHTGRPLGGAWPRSSTTLGGGRFLWGRLPPRPRRSGRCPLRTTPKPEGRTVPPPGGVPDSLSGRAIRLARRQISGRGGVRASVVPLRLRAPGSGKFGVGTPDREGRNQRALATALGQSPSPTARR